MDRPSSIAAPPRRRRADGTRWRTRSFLSVALLGLGLAFAHVWENVQVAELRGRIDSARSACDQHTARLKQLTAQLAEWRAQAEAAPDLAGKQGFTIPTNEQICLVSTGAVASPQPAAQLAATPAPRSLWDWLVSSAEAESRGSAPAVVPGAGADALP